MSTRDELEKSINDAGHFYVTRHPGGTLGCHIATTLIAEGWRKKPSKAEVIEWALSHFGTSNGTQVWVEFQGDADGLSDAILALMDKTDD